MSTERNPFYKRFLWFSKEEHKEICERVQCAKLRLRFLEASGHQRVQKLVESAQRTEF
jgi:hypothetical protein